MIVLLPLMLYRLFPPGVTKTPDAPKAARDALRTMGRLTRDERIVAVSFAFMVAGWVMAGALNPGLGPGGFACLGALLATNVPTLYHIYLPGCTPVTLFSAPALISL